MEETDRSAFEIIVKNAPYTATYAGALLILMPVVPIVAIIISIVVFSGPNPQAPATITDPAWLGSITPLLIGTLSALFLWFLLAFFFRRFTAVHRANEKSYYALLNHLSTLDAYLDTWLPDDAKQATLDMLLRARIQKPATNSAQAKRVSQPSGNTSNQPDPAELSGAAAGQPLNKSINNVDLEEVLHFRNAVYLALIQRSTSWVVGNGYVELWDLMDSAEEALTNVALPEKVIGDAVYDEMRLNDSKIDNSEEWANKLRSAVKALDADSVRYLKPALGTQLPGERTRQLALQETETQPPATGQEGVAGTQQQKEARAILRKVREMIDDFNTKSWDALISARNQLLATMALVGLTTYVFVNLAILFHVKTIHIVVATIFAFVGALAGLIGRLYVESQSDTTIDDYRLSTARLLVTPLLSGLAAVIGVLVVAKVDALDQIYTFNALVTNLIIAATFGLTPNLLLNQLQKKSDGYKANLQSTLATSGK